jgi:hypothetical protein
MLRGTAGTAIVAPRTIGRTADIRVVVRAAANTVSSGGGQRRQPQRLGQVRPGGKHQDLPQALAWTVEVREEQVDARPGPVLFTPGQSTANHDQVLPRV